MDNIRTLCLQFRAFRAHYSKGDYKKGLKLYQQIIDSGHRNISAYWGMAVCYHLLGDNEAAEAAAKEALEISPNYFQALQLLASIYAEQDKDDITYKYISQALSNIPRSTAEMSPRLANFAKKIGRYTSSAKPEDYVEEHLALEEEDRIWISWASDFKKDYEVRNPDKAQVLTKRVHSNAPEDGA